MGVIKKHYAWLGSIGVIFLLSVFAISPFFHSGFFSFHDDTQVARVFEMGRALQDGMFPVRWVRDLGYGFGYPIFNFYAPLPYYIGGVLTLVGIDALLATKITFIIAILLSGVAMYLFSRKLFGEIPAIVAAILYVYFPYHAVNIYVRGDLAELFAYGFLPLVFLGLYMIGTHTKEYIPTKAVLLTGISMAFVVISHNLTFYMTMLFVGIFFIVYLFFRKNKKVFATSLFFALALGFLLSAFYAIPAILEMGYTNVFSQVGGGAHYPDHFVCINQLWNSQWGFGGSTKECIDGLSFRLGKQNILFAISSLILLSVFMYKRKIDREKRVFLYILIGLVFSLFMMTSLSDIVWTSLPFSSFLQYPWRFLNFVGLFMAFIIGMGVYATTSINKKVQFGILIIVLIATYIYSVKLFVPQELNKKNVQDYTNTYYLNRVVSKISDEYLPPKFNREVVLINKIEIEKGLGEVTVTKNKTNFLEGQVSLTIPSVIKINIAHFPGWVIRINDKVFQPKITSSGYTVLLDPGKYKVIASYHQTPIQISANLLTIIGIFIVVFGIMKSRKNGKKKTS